MGAIRLKRERLDPCRKARLQGLVQMGEDTTRARLLPFNLIPDGRDVYSNEYKVVFSVKKALGSARGLFAGGKVDEAIGNVDSRPSELASLLGLCPNACIDNLKDDVVTVRHFFTEITSKIQMANDPSSNKVLALFAEKKFVTICAPMVRYSKLAFRQLVRRHGVDIAYTPMIISDCFVRSKIARDVELTTCDTDRPLVVQFAAHNADDFASAVEYVAPFADGVDLNCGCPQRWAMSEGYGAQLLRHPEKIADMIQMATRRTKTPISVKVRISDNIHETIELARRAERAGAAWITVHGRTPRERCQPVNYPAIALVKSSLSIPVVANGDITSNAIAEKVWEITGVNGVMAARGLLSNPAMFDDGAVLEDVVKEWVDISLGIGTPFPCFHHHLMFMMESVLSRSGLVFQSLASHVQTVVNSTH